MGVKRVEINRHCLLVLRMLTALWVGLALLSMPVQAANKPCSGRKGGVSHCQGDTFVCNDGSVSASKKSCQATFGGMSGLMATKGFSEVRSGEECKCRSGVYCTGPRGGRYCVTDGGKKSYLGR